MGRTFTLGVALPMLCAATFACTAPPSPVRPTPSAAASAPVYQRKVGFDGPTKPRFSVSDDHFFATPWPSEMRRRSDGRPDLSRFPGRDHFALRSLFELIDEHLLGFSIAPVVYFAFDSAIDPDTIAKAIDTGAIRLVDFDEGTSRGTRIPIEHRLFDGAKLVPDGTLAIRPKIVLEPDHTYLAVIERELTPDLRLGTTDDFERIKATSDGTSTHEPARRLYAPAFDWLKSDGVGRADVAALALFHTQAARVPVQAMIRAVGNAHPKLVATGRAAHLDEPSFRAIEGYYCTPNFQTGIADAPFMASGGTIERKDGVAIEAPIPESADAYVAECAGKIRAKFILTVPTSPAPDAGFPLLVYAHGTTGDAGSMLGADSFADRAAHAGIAAVSTDQPLHGSGDPRGARPGSASSFRYRFGPFPIPLPNKGKGGELAFYNAIRLPVLRDNLLQAIADGAVLARLVLSDAVAKDPVVVSVDGSFDRDRGYIASGHSQGSQSMAALGAMDPLATATVLSACGGDFGSAAFARKDTKRVQQLIELVLLLNQGELDAFHPYGAVFQAVLDPIDPQTFGAVYRRRSSHPHPALLISGVGDTMTPDVSGAHLARAMGLVPLAPMPKPIPGLTPRAKVTGNGPNGETLALLQLAPSYAYEPHFVTFRESTARLVMSDFLRGIAAGDPKPVLKISGAD